MQEPKKTYAGSKVNPLFSENLKEENKENQKDRYWKEAMSNLQKERLTNRC